MAINLGSKENETSKGFTDVFWHEQGHIADQVNDINDTESRENYANKFAAAGGFSTTLNDFLFRDNENAFTNQTISTYKANNTAQLNTNNAFVNTLQPNNLDYKTEIFTRPLNGLHPIQIGDYRLSIDHAGVVVTNKDKNYIENVLNEASLINPNIDVNDYTIHDFKTEDGSIEYGVVISAGPENEDSMISNPGKLTVDAKGDSDFNRTDVENVKNYKERGEQELIQQFNAQTKDNERDIDIQTVVHTSLVKGQEWDYSILPDLSTRNSNSEAASVCGASGSTNCNLSGIRPGEFHPINLGTFPSFSSTLYPLLVMPVKPTTLLPIINPMINIFK